MSDLEKLKYFFKSLLKDNLISLCEKKGVDATGTKEDLVERLMEVYEGESFSDAMDETIMKAVFNKENPSSSTIHQDEMLSNLNCVVSDLKNKLRLMENEILVLRRDKEKSSNDNKQIVCETNSFSLPGPMSGSQSNDVQRPNQPNKNVTIENPSIMKSLPFIENLLFDFSPQSGERNFQTWVTNTIMIKRKYNLDDDVMKMLVVKKLKDKALKWFHSRSDNLNISFDELINRMEIMFGQKKRRHELRQKFEKRTWHPNENFADYYHDKMILAGDLDFQNEEMVDYIIEGIKNKVIANQLKMMQISDPEELLNACSNIVNDQPSYSREFRGNNYSRPPAKHFEAKSVNNNSKISTGTTQQPSTNNLQSNRGTFFQKSIRCYNCNLPGHTYDKCTKPKREKNSCYKCGSMEHSFRSCPTIKSDGGKNE